MNKLLVLFLCFFIMTLAQRGHLAVELEKLSSTEAETLSVKGGLLISKVKPNSSAFSAGLKPYDVILKVDEKEVFSGVGLQKILNTKKIGEVVKILVLRREKRLTFDVKLQEPEKQTIAISSDKSTDNHFKFFNESEDINKLMQQAQSQMFNIQKRHKKLMQSFNSKQPAFFSSGNTSSFSQKLFFDGEYRIKFTNNNNKKHLKITNKKNKVIFSGAVNTPQQIKKIPQNLRKRVLQIIQ